MLDFLKRRKIEQGACKLIGVELHRQIKEAFDLNERETSARLQTSFTAGYIYWFVRIGFTTITGVSGERPTDKYLRQICDGVLSRKLFEILNRQLAALQLARNIDETSTIRSQGSAISPTAAIQLFEIGTEAGASDAGCFVPLSGKRADNLRKYLLGEKLDYKPITE